MNRQERVELLANALISEVVQACQPGGQARAQMVVENSIDNAKAAVTGLLKERTEQAVAGKNIFQAIYVAARYVMFSYEVRDEINLITSKAFDIATEEVDILSASQLKDRSGKASVEGAFRAIVSDILLEAGL